MNAKQEKMISFCVIATDLLALLLSYVCAVFFWGTVMRQPLILGKEELTVSLGVLLTSFVITFLFFDLSQYFIKRGYIEELFHVCKLSSMLFLMTTLLLYVGKFSDWFSRGVYICTVLFFVILCTAFRAVLKKIMRNKFQASRKQIMLVTTQDRAERVIRHINTPDNYDSAVTHVAIVDANLHGQKIAGVTVDATYEDMLDVARQGVVDEVFFHISYASGRSLKKYIEEFEEMGITVHINMSVAEGFDSYSMDIDKVGGYPVITIANNFYEPTKLFLKRVIDIIGGLFGCILLGLALLIVGPAIKLDSPGPVFFRQKRVGRNGRFFYIYKFRSMYVNAEEQKQELMDQNEMKGHMFKMTDDPRITRVGKVIRAASIDELPQFLNVLRGDMSLVGTRPPTVDEFRHYEAHHKRRLSMKPGITGMWQVSGRSDIGDFEEVVRLDVEYIDNWSLALDFKIMLKTMWVVLNRVGSR